MKSYQKNIGKKLPMLFCFTAFIAFTFSCNDFKKNNSHKNIPDADIKKGKALAAIYCKSCHMLPDPSSLDTKSWEQGVLPNMGPFLGIFNNGFQQYPSSRNDRYLRKNFYPSQPLINPDQWQQIIAYYTSISPDSLQGQFRNKPIKLNLADFEVKQPGSGYPAPVVTFIKVDTVASRHSLMLYDNTLQKLLWYDSHLLRSDSLPINNSPVVAADIHKENLVICTIGEINPNNGKFGKLNLIEKNQPDSISLIDSLARPVSFQSADLNGDGRLDYLICEFGHLTGELAWYENTGNKVYTKHVLRGLPGAIATVINDYNHDGKPDIWALFSQGDEGIFLFTNKGNGLFEEKRILSFPPMQGSTYFELCDFNNDGYPDILYTCGDNADFSPVLKPYHGVYIFLNDGSNQFTQKYFFPIHGCFKALARDYDNDGDLDIAAISFFADYVNQPEEGFVFLKNNGNFDFEPYSFPQSESGRWLTMDADDLDGDGKTDIVLGNFSVRLFTKRPSIDWKQGPPFIVLKNITR
ncbi:MAG: VCBS repeat-containing protein [Bacteroidota bacterium]